MKQNTVTHWCGGGILVSRMNEYRVREAIADFFHVVPETKTITWSEWADLIEAEYDTKHARYTAAWLRQENGKGQVDRDDL